MPKRTDIQSVLIIGAGPIIIGQACEFDYSGAQACKALKSEGYRVILVNSNPATIMTDPLLADATYVEPIHWESVEKIIEKERPDALLPTMGGQTGLNTALTLAKKGILKKYNVELIGASREAIDKAEDRELFDKTMKGIGIETPRSGIAHSMEEALIVQEKLGFPCIIRPSFTLGGSGGGVAYNIQEFKEICEKGLDLSPTTELLIDESLLGWKEYELEVVRDKNDNCIIICSIENLDPMGVHTGDSITIAPAQTLTDKEYQVLRDQSFRILREIGVETGGSNVQFGICPETGRVVVIEMNPRVSRSSALASKATGFPIAKVAALLSVGFSLDELQNDITNGLTPASFEPSIDYIVTKIPKFAFEKFPQADDRLTTQMKSVGEVMGIGRTFQESLQKALQSLEEDMHGFESILDHTMNQNEALRYQLTFPGCKRILYVADAIRLGWSAEEINQLTGMDFWYLHQIIDLVNEENILQDMHLQDIDFSKMLNLKQKGFADQRIADLTRSNAIDVRKARKKLGVMPSFKRVDTCAAEFATETAYMYSAYEGECESRPTKNKKVVVLGSGPNRIGQGIEFDYCCVHASFALQEEGFESIMINCNPETVSTDYDTSDRLYFEPITEEKVLDIIDLEQPEGVIIQFGGQTPLKLSETLLSNNVKILGTDVDAIDRSEDRERFQSLANQLNLKQPPNSTVKNLEEAIKVSDDIGFPIVVRPSYVLGGRAMELVHTKTELEKYLKEAVEVSDKKPILLDGYLTDAIEVDVDVISDGSEIQIGGILQHIEQAGIHSGDSACSLPPYSLSKQVLEEIEKQAKKIAAELNVVGLMNIQFAVQDMTVFIIEVNPRASRTVPFISKCLGQSLVKLATKTMVGKSLQETSFSNALPKNYFFVKEAVLPFDKFPAVDPILGPEMKSTGEVMGIGLSFGEAYAKAQKAANKIVPDSGLAFVSVKESDKKYLPDLIPLLIDQGFELISTKGTAEAINKLGYKSSFINKVNEGRPHIVDELLNNKVNLLINTTEGRQSIEDSASIRRTALQNKLFCITTIFGAFAILEAMNKNSKHWIYHSLQEIN
ncbi:MAG: carbamoyl-phosphate synthase large subunit [SAR86 cluster bacterium]|uniref:Carbamoyl phosphate synthase large chain n=1 Tax=SAR86 cluster bacterium TaxID=2030880 RepID=A0A368BQN2_9GAMM|nr:MAG: carbamoyl-phosphate synthase large subunit [SAR86 cluster bacterium]|tara:strand:+ start:2304 stop:5510 length:3207 start_codon:yes stop_codon:yes gene_type:complete